MPLNQGNAVSKKISKNTQKAIREFAGVAYERELSAAFRALHGEFSHWANGEIDAFQLNEKVHEFHQGISRELYGRYVGMDAEFGVASALLRGILSRAEVGEPVYTSVEGIILSLSSLKAQYSEPEA